MVGIQLARHAREGGHDMTRAYVPTGHLIPL
jgi:hypothetical protein